MKNENGNFIEVCKFTKETRFPIFLPAKQYVIKNQFESKKIQM